VEEVETDSLSRSPVQIVVNRIQFLSNHEAIDRFFAEIALDSSKANNA
jgi:hypothetical protein